MNAVQLKVRHTKMIQRFSINYQLLIIINTLIFLLIIQMLKRYADLNNWIRFHYLNHSTELREVINQNKLISLKLNERMYP